MKAMIIAPNSLEQVMKEVETEVKPILTQEITPRQKEAESCLFFTLSKTTADIFDWLPAEEKSEIFTCCGTWFDIGVLFGKSPELLVKILDKANPLTSSTEVPEEMIAMMKRAAGLNNDGGSHDSEGG